MKRIIFTAPRTVEIENVAIPNPGPGMLLVKVKVSGISAGTEMTYYRGAPLLRLAKDEYTYPIWPGYEVVGIVQECGSGVSAFKSGDRVVCMGNHAEYAIIEASSAEFLPAGLPDEEYTLAVLSVTTMHAIRRAAFQYGDTVVVIGLGVVGLLAAQQARIGGAGQVIGVDLDGWRCKMAKNLGIDRVVNNFGEIAHQEILEATGGIGADVVIEAAGIGNAVNDALTYVRDRGRIVILGYHTGPVNFMPGDEFWYKEVDILATRATGPTPGLPIPYVRWTSERSLKLAVDLLAKGAINTTGMVTHRFPYSKADEAYRMIDQKSENFLQVVFLWD